MGGRIASLWAYLNCQLSTVNCQLIKRFLELVLDVFAYLRKHGVQRAVRFHAVLPAQDEPSVDVRPLLRERQLSLLCRL